MVLQKLHTPFNYKDVITAYIKEIKNRFSELMYDIFYYVPGILQPRSRYKRRKQVQLQVIRKALFVRPPSQIGGKLWNYNRISPGNSTLDSSDITYFLLITSLMIQGLIDKQGYSTG